MFQRRIRRADRFRQPRMPVWPGLLAAVAMLSALAAAPAAAQVELYVRKPSLPQTMLATRSQLEGWQAVENDARQAVRVGPWYCIDPGEGGKFDAAGAARAGIAGDPRWTKCAAAGAVAPKLPTAPAGYLFTTIRAARPLALSVELSRHERFGGFAYRPPADGAGVEPTAQLVWLNGRPIELHNRLDGYQRVPVAKRRGWHEALLADVPLERGENRLVVALGKGPQRSWFNAVRVSSDLTPVLWAMIENDFPRGGHPLLEEIDFHWFDSSGGWFSGDGDARLERQFVEEAIQRLGLRGEAIRLRRDRLTGGGTAASASWLDLCASAAELQAGLRALDSTAAAVENLHAARPAEYPAPGFLARVAELQKALLDGASADRAADEGRTAALFGRIEDLRHEALVAKNPLLAGKKLLLVKRYTYDSNHYYDEYDAGIRHFGGGLFTAFAGRREVRGGLARGGRRPGRPLRPVVRCAADRVRLQAAAAAGLSHLRNRRRRHGPAATDVPARRRRPSGSPPMPMSRRRPCGKTPAATGIGPTTCTPAICPTAASSSLRRGASTACSAADIRSR